MTYHFRVNGANAVGTTQGADMTFTTPPEILSVSAAAAGDLITDSPITFMAAVDPSDAVVTWDFGDGSPLAAGAVVQHTYTVAGSYTVTVMAARPNGAASGSTTLPLTIGDGAAGIVQMNGSIKLKPGHDQLMLSAVLRLSPAQLTNSSTMTISVGGLTRSFSFTGSKATVSNAGSQLRFMRSSIKGAAQARISLKATGDLKHELFTGLTLDASGHPTEIVVRIRLNGGAYAKRLKTTFIHRGSFDNIGFGSKK
jgi:hypothetical protein